MNVSPQNLSNVNPTIFVPITEPIRPNIIVMFIAMALQIIKIGKISAMKPGNY